MEVLGEQRERSHRELKSDGSVVAPRRRQRRKEMGTAVTRNTVYPASRKRQALQGAGPEGDLGLEAPADDAG